MDTFLVRWSALFFIHVLVLFLRICCFGAVGEKFFLKSLPPARAPPSPPLPSLPDIVSIS